MCSLKSLSPGTLHQRLRDHGLLLRVGPFTIRVNSRVRQIGDLIELLYEDYPIGSSEDYQDFHLRVEHASTLRRWIRPAASFDGDGEAPFAPMPAAASFPLLEWGFNWRVATTAHQYLMLHAAVVERNGITVLMPALPGSGKSTLAAALMCRGWRLLSDEFGLVRPGTIDLVPFPRPIPLKNESIPLISRFAPQSRIGPVFPGTRKGDVAHLKPTSPSVQQADEKALVTHVVFPLYQADRKLTMHRIEKARAFLKVSANSFNYQLLGLCAFRTVAAMIEQSHCLSLVYGDLEEAVAAFDELQVSLSAEETSRAPQEDGF